MFFFGSEVVSVPLSSPGHCALCSAVPKSRRLSPNPAGRSLLCSLAGRAVRGALPPFCTAAAPLLPQAKPLGFGFFFFPLLFVLPECQRPAPRRLPTRGTSIARRTRNFLFLLQSSSHAGSMEGPVGTPASSGAGDATAGAAFAARPGLSVRSGSRSSCGRLCPN